MRNCQNFWNRCYICCLLCLLRMWNIYMTWRYYLHLQVSSLELVRLPHMSGEKFIPCIVYIHQIGWFEHLWWLLYFILVAEIQNCITRPSVLEMPFAVIINYSFSRISFRFLAYPFDLFTINFP